MRALEPALTASALLLVVTAAPAAWAAPPTDCPPGSVGKDENGFQWCEPTVCVTGADCGDRSKVCRPMALCVEVGTLGAEAGAGPKRLVVRSQCASSDKKCPSQTTCLDGNRCMGTADAERMGILVDAGTTAEAPRKSVCGCSTPGAKAEGYGAFGAAVLGAIAILRRRARRSSRRDARDTRG
ncbi:MAG TPA: MYXO-CTERM sorting domain-containing protein [Polyangiaceae bacterium]